MLMDSMLGRGEDGEEEIKDGSTFGSNHGQVVVHR